MPDSTPGRERERRVLFSIGLPCAIARAAISARCRSFAASTISAAFSRPISALTGLRCSCAVGELALDLFVGDVDSASEDHELFDTSEDDTREASADKLQVPECTEGIALTEFGGLEPAGETVA